MRISDWSSDVCSSDLLDRVQRRLRRRNGVPGRPAGRAGRLRGVFQPADRAEPGTPYLPRDLAAFLRTGAALDGEPLRVQPVLAAPQRHSRFRGLGGAVQSVVADLRTGVSERRFDTSAQLRIRQALRPAQPAGPWRLNLEQ